MQRGSSFSNERFFAIDTAIFRNNCSAILVSVSKNGRAHS
jgi:hypothetical protein